MVTATLDTNVFIRAALRPRSPSARVVDARNARGCELLLERARACAGGSTLPEPR